MNTDGAATGRLRPGAAGGAPGSVDAGSVDPGSVDPAGAGPVSSDEPRITLDRVGPGGTVASDSAFGVALVGLWHQLAESGAPVGFPVPASRIDVAARVAELVDGLRRGTVVGVAANRARRLVGVGLLRTGRGIHDHTGRVEVVLVHPDRAGDGLGTSVLREVLALGASRGVQRVDLEMQDDEGLAAFFARFGFAEWGRRPSWLRLGAADVRDEVVLGAVLAQAG